MALSFQQCLHPDFGALAAAVILASVGLFLSLPAGEVVQAFLVAFCLVSSVAGMCSAWLANRAGRSRHEVVRAGFRGSFICSIVSAGLSVAYARCSEGVFAATRALVAVVPSVLPAAFCGLVAAVLTAVALDPPVAVDAEPARGSRMAMGLAVLIGVGGLLSPFVPAMPVPPPRVADRPGPAGVTATPASSAPARMVPSFEYEVPKEFKSATAGEITIFARRGFGRVEPRSPVVISGGSRFLAFWPSAYQGMVEVVDLHRAATVGRFSPGGQGRSMSFSPDAKRMICERPSEVARFAVVEVDSGKVTSLPMPRGKEVPACRLLWWEDNEVLLFSDRKGDLLLNLQTLLVSDADASSRWKNLTSDRQNEIRESGAAAFGEASWRPKAAVRPLAAELPETLGTSGWNMACGNQWGLEELSRPFVNLSLAIARGNADRVLLSPDRAKLVLVQNDLLTVLYLGVTAKPPLAYSLDMHRKPDECEEAKAVAKAMETHDLAALVYAPMINPLNGKVVGPDRGRIKAHLRFTKWDGEKASAWVRALFLPVETGDIVADLHLYAERDGKLLAVRKKEPWWTVIDAGSADPAGGVPTNEDLAKLREAAETKNRKPPALLEPLPLPQPIVVPTPASKEQQPDAPAANAKAIRDFVIAHHRKASGGDIAGMVADYAERVDHFNNGVVNREFILKDEIEYHAKYVFVNEEVKGDIRARELLNGVTEASYALTVNWQKRANNELGGSEIDVTLEVVKASGGFRIVKHRSVKRNP